MGSENTEKNSRRKVWTNEGTRLFLSCYNARKDEFSSRKKRFGYERVLEDMISLGFEHEGMEAKSLEGKMRTLMQTYKAAKNKARQTGTRCKAPFMAELDEIFCQKTVERKGPKVTISESVHIPSGKGPYGKQTCRLCVRSCKEYKCLFDTTGRANNVYSTTIKYFDPMHLNLTQDYPQQQIAICLQCWSRICEFDSFKYSVLLAQNTISQTNTKMDDSNKLERYFGKQQGYDPLAESVPVRNEAGNDEMDESEDFNQSDDDMSNGDDYQEDEDISDGEDNEENDESYQGDDSNNEIIEDQCNNLPQPKLLSKPSTSDNKIAKATTEKTNEVKAKTCKDGKVLKLISKYRDPDDKEVILNTSPKTDNSWSSNCKEDITLFDGNNEDNDKYDNDCDLPHNSVDDLRKHKSTTHTSISKYVCYACGITAFSSQALSNHVCSGRT